MIPVTLSLTNFMSYGTDVPPLDFTQLHTACIAGANGHGKSSLIDAITWALWGRTRAPGNDDLVRTGQREMSVDFTFDLAERRYRVLRKYLLPAGRRRSGKPVLEFQVRAEDGSYHVISGGTLTETQQQIRDVLHMDYDTFTNSALLLQGHADQFTAQRPADRKKVLGTILGLDQYDRLEDRARARAREHDTRRAGLDGVIGSLDEDLATRQGLETELAAARAELTQLDERAQLQRTALDDLRGRRELLEGKRAQLEQLRRSLALQVQQADRWQLEIAEGRRRLEEGRALLARRAEVAEGYGQLMAARQTVTEQEQRFRRLSALEKSRGELELAVLKANEELGREHALLGQQMETLAAQSARGEAARRDMAGFKTPQADLKAADKALGARRQVREEMALGLAAWRERVPRLERERDAIHEKAGLIHVGGDTHCPLCETELGPERLDFIQRKWSEEAAQNARQIAAGHDKLARDTQALKTLDVEITATGDELEKRRRSLEQQRAVLEKQVTDAAAAAAASAELKENLAQIEDRLARRDFAVTEQEALVGIAAQRAEIDYAPEIYEAAQHTVSEKAGFEAQFRALEQAAGQREQEQATLQRAEAALAELEVTLTADRLTDAALAEETALLPALRDDLTRAEAEFATLEAARQGVQKQLATTEAELRRLAQVKTRRAARGKELKEALSQAQIYRDLANAFGKRGVQALLIEIALPEIESEANRLLGRMTDNRMHLKIETQRQTKAGEVAETLDIKISDELGTRTYEMFSGGEAFRINFALRIALSRLLAHRAGAPLPTLIIDEGFGTQDRDGIDKLKEAINTIQPDFEKILVITHIDELKDAFPVRIDVEKTEAGSTWRFA